MKNIKDQIQPYLDRKLCTMKQSTTFPDLYVVKYARRVFYDNLWDSFLAACRGLVVDKNFDVIVHPLTKMFNYGENGWFPSSGLDDKIYATLKYNGFMLSVTLHPTYGMIFSTTGSLDSDYVKLGIDMYVKFEHLVPRPEMGVTQVFECCTPKDPHIIQETEGLYYLGRRKDGVYETNLDSLFETTLAELFKNSDDVEGWVCYNDTEVWKIKTPRYLRKKFFARANNLHNALNKAHTALTDYYSLFDEDFYGIVDFIKTHAEEMATMTEFDRIKFLDEKYFGI